MKIAIIGYSGAGKSTLAKRLADEIGVQPLYLDTVHYLPNWQERDRTEARAVVRATLNQSNWVIDGTYQSLLREERLEQADDIIWMNYPRLLCLWRVILRTRRFRGQTRESMASGCTERLDWEFVWWILYEGRTRERIADFWAIQKQYPQKTVVLKNDRVLRRYLHDRQLRRGEQRGTK